MKIVAGKYPEEKNIDAWVGFLGNGNVNIVFLWRYAAYCRDIIKTKNIADVGYRDPIEQKQLYDLYQAYLKNPSIRPIPNEAAAPGSSWHEYGFAIDLNRYKTNPDGSGQYYGTINADFDAWLANPNADTTLRKYGLSHAVRTERWHIQPIESLGVGDKAHFADADDYLRNNYVEPTQADIITPSNVAKIEVYDLQTAYQELGYPIGAFKNMLDPSILDGRDGKYGTTCGNITKQIQAKYSLSQTGNVDIITYGKIVLELIADGKSKLISSNNEIAVLSESVKAKTATISSLSLENTSLKSTNATLVQEKSVLTSEVALKTSTIATLQNENGMLERDNAELGKKIESDKFKIDTIEETARNNKEIIDNLNEQIAVLKIK